MIERANKDYNFIKNFCFSDEADFFLNGFLSVYNLEIHIFPYIEFRQL